MRRVAPWLVLLLSACSAQVGVTRAALTGQDGAKTVSGTEVVNLYAGLAADAAAGDTTLTVTDATGLSAGDMILVVAVQGATIDTTDTTSYGTVSALGAAGNNELWLLSKVAGTTLTLDLSCGLTGLAHAYPLASHPQVVRVPQYTTLDVPAGATLTGTPWNGTTGGFVAVHVESAASVEGTIDASGLGLRTGTPVDGTATLHGDVTDYVTAATTSGEKGESIAGAASDYDALSGRYGRGAPANGGGGGNGYLSGGGGGANATTSTGTYSGEGTMSTSVMGGSAWALDPNVGESGGPGGGRGGYSLSGIDDNATQTAPGALMWGGNLRQEVGGLGGHGLDGTGRIFLGGGGGAAQYDGTTPPAVGSAGRGGGVVLLIASTLTGNGGIHADGNHGVDGQLVGTGSAVTIANGGGGGGGGGGGLVLIHATGTTTLSVSARGGTGGDVSVSGTFAPTFSGANGPGGGGAGGVVELGTGLVATTDTGGALGGTTSAAALAEFSSNGASSGDTGPVSTVAVTAAPSACLPADVGVTLADSVDPAAAGSAYAYTATVKNAGPNAAYDLEVTFTLPSNETLATITATGWSCSLAGAVYTCTLPLLLSGASSTITVGVTAPGFGTSVTATVQVTSREDPDGTNDRATQTTVITAPQSDLALTDVAPSAIASNGGYTYALTVTNDGPASAPTFQIVDVLPTGVMFGSAGGTGFTCTGTTTVTCTTTTALASGASATVTLSVTAPALTAQASVADSATVSITGTGSADSNPANDMASETTMIVPVDLSLAKSDLFDPVTTGGALSYSLTVTNPATVSAPGVEVDDVLPAGTTYISAKGTGWSCSLSTDGTTIMCTSASIDASSTSAINVALSAPTTAGMVSNTATVRAVATDPALGNNTSTAITTVNTPPVGHDDLSITATATPEPAPISTSLVYTVDVANVGPDGADDVSLVASLPGSVALVSATGSGWTCTPVKTSVTCTLGTSLTVGKASPITITVTVPSVSGTLDTSFVVTSSTDDTNVSNNTTSVTSHVFDPALQNHPPVFTLIPGLTTPEDTVLKLATAINLTDPDSRTDPIELDVVATRCAFTLSTTTGLDFLEGDGILDPVLHVRGTVDALQTALTGATLTPVPNYDGVVTLALHADDLGHNGLGGDGIADAVLSVTVTPVDDPPIAADDTFTVNANVTSSLDVLLNDRIGQPGQVLMLVSLTPASHGVATIVDNAVQYAPTAYYVGDDTFMYTISDGTVQASATVVVHVQAYTPPTTAILGGGACSAAPGRTTGSPWVVLLLLALYGIMPRLRNHSYCSRKASSTDVGR